MVFGEEAHLVGSNFMFMNPVNFKTIGNGEVDLNDNKIENMALSVNGNGQISGCFITKTGTANVVGNGIIDGTKSTRAIVTTNVIGNGVIDFDVDHESESE